MDNDVNPVIARIRALATHVSVDRITVSTVGESEHWFDLYSDYDCKERVLVTCSESELTAFCEEVRSELKRSQTRASLAKIP